MALQCASSAVKRTNLCRAINGVLDMALGMNDTSIVFGEDVGSGGVFRCTEGLQKKYGRQRVFNTPLSEQGIVGFGIGAAAAGYTAIAEIQFADYIYPAMDQIINEAAKYRYRSGGVFNVGGLTIRAPYGAIGHGGMYHSQAPEAFLTHAAGIKVVIPSGPLEAKGLLLSCIEDKNPVVFFEPKIMYRLKEELVPEGVYRIPLGKARVVQEGSDVTIITWGQQVSDSMDAAKILKDRDGIECEVVDVRTLIPLDLPCLRDSVRKTGRLAVVHEAPKTSGFGAEIVSQISESCFSYLKAPPCRITGYDIPFPRALEHAYLPSIDRIYHSVRSMFKTS
jgi:2-oxoisovalerate dehydrogenase E1 component beta subunit